MAFDNCAFKTVETVSEEDMLARAEAAVRELTSDYPGWAMADVEQLLQQIASIPPGAAREDPIVTSTHKKAHDMRGQGGSFGYPVITAIAESFCRFLNGLSTVDKKALEILAAHAKAMRVILANGLAGDGGPAGKKLIGELQAVVQKHVDR